MDRGMNEWTDRWMDRQTDGQIDERTDGYKEKQHPGFLSSWKTEPRVIAENTQLQRKLQVESPRGRC